MSNEPRPVTDRDLTAWLKMAQKVVSDYMEKTFPTLPPKILSVEKGKKNARIVVSSNGIGGSHRSAYCFIDLTTGDILKTETWKKPAKHPRGNIFAENPVAGINHHGANYL